MAAKLFFVFLILVAVVFFFTMWAGAPNGSQSPRGGNEANDIQNNPWTARIGNMLGSLSPKLDLPQKEFHFGAIDLMVKVPEAKTRFRNATLQVTSGCVAPANCSNVAIRYESKPGEGEDLKLNKQSWTPSKDKPNQASLVILQSGGTIHMQCLQVPACIAKLQ
jgi:hypothetical protein